MRSAISRIRLTVWANTHSKDTQMMKKILSLFCRISYCERSNGGVNYSKLWIICAGNTKMVSRVVFQTETFLAYILKILE